MGVYGMLAVAAILFCTRYLMTVDAWSNRLAALSFWGLNIGLMLMIVLNIFPAGVLQMIASYKEGFWFARSPEFMHSHLFQMLTWARIAGDITFVVIGVLPLVVLVVRGMFHLRPAASAPPEPSLTPASQNV